MKNYLLKSIFVLIMGSAVIGCSSDSSSDPIVTKTKVSITKVEISTIPATNGTINWDIGSNADLYVNIHDETTSSPQLRSATVWDINILPGQAFQCTMPANQNSDLVNSSITIQAYDDDSDNVAGGADDYMGEAMFKISDYTSGPNKYPPLVYKTVNGLTVSIYLTWE
jgi:hypothetical protein